MSVLTAPSPRVLHPLIERLRGIVGTEGLIGREDELLVYECDGYVVEKKTPDVVVFPETTEQVVAIVRACNEFDVPFVPRGTKPVYCSSCFEQMRGGSSAGRGARY